MATLTCPNCNACPSPAEKKDGWCEACGKKLPSSMQTFTATVTSSTRTATLGKTPSKDRPWIPSQLISVSLLFGPAACGVIAGFNFIRLGQRQYSLPSMFVGFILFLVEAGAIVFLVPEEALKFVCILANVGAGLVFMLAQKPTFDEWKATHWAPAKEGDRYKPNRLGLLFGVSLVCVALEVGMVLLLIVAAGKW